MSIVKVKEMLYQIGYARDNFSDDYAVQIDGTSVLKFDSIAFSSQYIQDISTSCIAIQNIESENEKDKYLTYSKYAATPILVLVNEEKLQVWNITSDTEKLLLENKSNVVQLYFEKNRFDFLPENLVHAKYGMHQLTLFEAAGLIDISREATCKILNEEFEKGLLTGKEYLKTIYKTKNSDLNNLTSITMHIISALIINSKINKNDKIPDINELLGKLSESYEDYYEHTMIYKYGEELVCRIYESLNKTINYKSVDHELLGYFYETTLLQADEKKAAKLRKDFGIYYTPKFLADEIVDAIPFEMLDEENRIVFDGSCGSGSLLLSATKRLEKLIDYQKDGSTIHNYLTRSVYGYDTDKFASEVARMSLLLYSLPYGNEWNIQARDLLKISELDMIPSVIIGNPPYEEKRADSRKSQKAVEFLEKYMEWIAVGGFLGIILPESFLQNDSATAARKKLLKEFDIFEIWSIPGSIFRNNCATTIVIARKKQKDMYARITKIRMLVHNKDSIKQFKVSQRWDFEFFTDSQDKWLKDKNCVIKFSPIECIIQKMQTSKWILNDVSKNITGLILPSDYDGYGEKNAVGTIKYIDNASHFQKYYISGEMEKEIKYLDYDQLIENENIIKMEYKGLRIRKEYSGIFNHGKKVLVKMSSTPGEIECISAFIDEQQCYPSHSFFVVVSNDEQELPCEVLCALLNSKAVNAYVRMHCVKRTLTTTVIRSIPIPEFSCKQKERIVCLVKSLYMNSLIACSKELDDIICEAYGLTQEEKEQLNRYWDVYKGKAEEKKDFAKSTSVQTVTGIVESVDYRNGSCKILFMEYDDAMDISLTPDMPGWFLRENVQFSAKLINQERLTEIYPLFYSYLNDDDVIKRIENLFLASEKEGI